MGGYMRIATNVVRVAVAAIAVIGVTACEPQPQPARIVLTVDSTANGPDANLFDGVCATADGSCTLQAAFHQAQVFARGVDLVVPDGTYSPTAAIPVTGDVRLNWDAPRAVAIHATFDVRAGGTLWLDGVSSQALNRGPVEQPQLAVAGTARIRRSTLTHLTIAPDGAALAEDSMLTSTLDASGAQTSAVENQGSFVAVRSTLFTLNAPGAPPDRAVLVNDGGEVALLGSAIATAGFRIDSASLVGGTGTCEGTDIRSLGGTHVEVPCSMEADPGDTTGTIGLAVTIHPEWVSDTVIARSQISQNAPGLIDRIAVGSPGCDGPASDIFGRARGGDGDGDGIAGCDIGALEIVPAA